MPAGHRWKGAYHTGRGGNYPVSSWHVLIPVDTFIAGKYADGTIYYPVDFHANEPIELHWRMEVLDSVGYTFSVMFMFDSVKLKDGRMTWWNSEEAIAQSTKGNGYAHSVISEPSTVNLRP